MRRQNRDRQQLNDYARTRQSWCVFFCFKRIGLNQATTKYSLQYEIWYITRTIIEASLEIEDVVLYSGYATDHEGYDRPQVVHEASGTEGTAVGRIPVEPELLHRDSKRKKPGNGRAVHRESEGKGMGRTGPTPERSGEIARIS